MAKHQLFSAAIHRLHLAHEYPHDPFEALEDFEIPAKQGAASRSCSMSDPDYPGS